MLLQPPRKLRFLGIFNLRRNMGGAFSGYSITEGSQYLGRGTMYMKVRVHVYIGTMYMYNTSERVVCPLPREIRS